ncbi:hypothetical protein HDU76_013513 [Blyttiomyces sp. JEL0837]|nr:hypothetical protein HDU76_013513 [Blyttiomyces sp. JEL0837]
MPTRSTSSSTTIAPTPTTTDDVFTLPFPPLEATSASHIPEIGNPVNITLIPMNNTINTTSMTSPTPAIPMAEKDNGNPFPVWALAVTAAAVAVIGIAMVVGGGYVKVNGWKFWRWGTNGGGDSSVDNSKKGGYVDSEMKSATLTRRQSTSRRESMKKETMVVDMDESTQDVGFLVSIPQPQTHSLNRPSLNLSLPRATIPTISMQPPPPPRGVSMIEPIGMASLSLPRQLAPTRTSSQLQRSLSTHDSDFRIATHYSNIALDETFHEKLLSPVGGDEIVYTKNNESMLPVRSLSGNAKFYFFADDSGSGSGSEKGSGAKNEGLSGGKDGK